MHWLCQTPPKYTQLLVVHSIFLYGNLNAQTSYWDFSQSTMLEVHAKESKSFRTQFLGENWICVDEVARAITWLPQVGHCEIAEILLDGVLIGKVTADVITELVPIHFEGHLLHIGMLQ